MRSVSHSQFSSTSLLLNLSLKQSEVMVPTSSDACGCFRNAADGVLVGNRNLWTAVSMTALHTSHLWRKTSHSLFDDIKVADRRVKRDGSGDLGSRQHTTLGLTDWLLAWASPSTCTGLHMIERPQCFPLRFIQ